MDAEIKRKWVEALRSGEYQQGRGSLVPDDDSLCCIGVGFCVALPSENVGASWTDDAAERIGLTATQRDYLVRLNDEWKKSFAEIADYIDANL